MTAIGILKKDDLRDTEELKIQNQDLNTDKKERKSEKKMASRL